MMGKELLHNCKEYLETTLVRLRADLQNMSDKVENIQSLVNTLNDVLNEESNEESDEE